MLDFVAETAATAGLTDYRVLVNVGPAAGRPSSICTGTSSADARCRRDGAVTLIDRAWRDEVKEAMRARDDGAA